MFQNHLGNFLNMLMPKGLPETSKPEYLAPDICIFLEEKFSQAIPICNGTE